MRIIIAGDGDTGTHLARMLSVEDQDIVLMGTDRERLASLDAESNFITYEGVAVSANNLKRCNVDGADLFVAVTPDENVNILACEIAKGCGARRCVARVDNPELVSDDVQRILKRCGVDLTIYPERLAAEEIARSIKHNWLSDWIEIRHGELIVAGVRMHSSGLLCGLKLSEIPNDPRLFHVAAIKRGSEVMIPRGDDRLYEGDIVYFSLQPENIDHLPMLCGQVPADVRRIMITGAGRVTENFLEIAGGLYTVTVIDPDKERCRVIASRFPKVTVVNARANDVAVLKEEGIDDCDMLLALTGSSETNIVSCMVAREHGVGKTLARVEELQYIPEAKSLSIDKIINKKLINSGEVLSVMLDSRMVATQCMSIDNAEVTAIVATEGSRIVSRPISELSLPREITIAGVIRGNEGLLVGGSTLVMPGDHVVIFCVSGALGKVERLFR